MRVNLEIALYEGETAEGMAGWLRGRFGVEVSLDDEARVPWPVFVVDGDNAAVQAVVDWHESGDPEKPVFAE